jgi:hypothetical protein
LEADAAPVAPVGIHQRRMDAIIDLAGVPAANGFDLCTGMDLDIGVPGGTQQPVFSHACTAFDAGIGGFAVELDGVAAEKRAFSQSAKHEPPSRPAGRRPSARPHRHR